MRNRARIIEIKGFRGILTAIFMVTCLAAGFIAFPGYVAMSIWNHFAGYNLPQISLYQGVLLWAIIALSYYIFTKKNVSVSIASPKELNEEELNILMNRIKIQAEARALNKMLIKDIEELKKEDFSKSEETSESETIKK